MRNIIYSVIKYVLENPVKQTGKKNTSPYGPDGVKVYIQFSFLRLLQLCNCKTVALNALRMYRRLPANFEM